MLSAAPASAHGLERYNALVERSKANWTWPSGYLGPALELLRITPDYLARGTGLEILGDGELIGFCAIISEHDRLVLDHLWIEPDHIGRGAGAFAVSQVLSMAKKAERSVIDVWPDPPAEPFYVRQGFEPTGEQAPSRIPGGPAFRRVRLRVGNDYPARTVT